MKKTIKILALVMVAAMLCCALVSCGKTLKGTYSAEVYGTGAELVFSGSKVTINTKVAGSVLSTVEGKYSIKDDKITMTFEDDSEDADKYEGTFDFEEGDDYIKIGAFGKFTKAD